MNIKSFTYCFLSMLWISYAPMYIALQASRYFPKEKASEDSSNKLNIRAEEDIILDKMFEGTKKEGLKKFLRFVKKHIVDEEYMEPLNDLTPKQYMYLCEIWNTWKYNRKLNRKFVWKGNKQLWTVDTIIDNYILPLIILFQSYGMTKGKLDNPMRSNLVLSERLLRYIRSSFPALKMKISNVDKPFLVKITCANKTVQWNRQTSILVMKRSGRIVAFPTLVHWILTKVFIFYEANRQEKFKKLDSVASNILSEEDKILAKGSYRKSEKRRLAHMLTVEQVSHFGRPQEKDLHYDFTMQAVRIPNFFEEKTMNEMLLMPTQLSALNLKSKYIPPLAFYDQPIIRISILVKRNAKVLDTAKLLFTFFNGYPNYQSLFMKINLNKNLVIPIYKHIKQAWGQSNLRKSIPTSKLIKSDQEEGCCFFATGTPEYIYLMKGFFDESLQNDEIFSTQDINNMIDRPLLDDVVEFKENENNNNQVVPVCPKNAFKEYLKELWVDAILHEIESRVGFAQSNLSSNKKKGKKKKGQKPVNISKGHQSNHNNHRYDYRKQEKEWSNIGKELTKTMVGKIKKADRGRMQSMYLLGCKMVQEGGKSIRVTSKPTKNGYQFAIKFVDKINGKNLERTIGIHRFHGSKGAIDKKKILLKNLMRSTINEGVEAIQEEIKSITYHCQETAGKVNGASSSSVNNNNNNNV